MKIKPIAMFVSLAICGSLATGCASQDNKEPKDKKQESPVTTEITPSLEPAHTDVAAVTPEATTQSDPISQPQVVAETEIEMPEQTVFYFGFNKSDLTDDDVESLKEHAQYMQKNSNVIAQIEGHTDFHGPHAYNEQLSKKRAESVAKVLIEEGVPQSQIVINALADNKPMECKGDTRHNRRVELHYKEPHIASRE